MPGLFACWGYCYGCLVFLVLALVCALGSTFSFFGGTLCEFLDPQVFSAESVNGLMVKTTGRGISDSEQTRLGGDMIDKCLVPGADGMVLKTMTTLGCPADRNGTFPEACDAGAKVPQTVDYQMRVKVLGSVRKVFSQARVVH